MYSRSQRWKEMNVIHGSSLTMFTYSPSLVQGTLSFGKVLHSLTVISKTLCIHLDLVFLVTSSEAHSRNTFVTYPPSLPPPQQQASVDHPCPFGSQFTIFTVTIHSTLPVVPLFVGRRTHQLSPSAEVSPKHPELQENRNVERAPRRVSTNDAHGVSTER